MLGRLILDQEWPFKDIPTHLGLPSPLVRARCTMPFGPPLPKARVGQQSAVANAIKYKT